MCPNEHPSRPAVLGPPFGRKVGKEGRVVRAARRNVDEEKGIWGAMSLGKNRILFERP